MAFNLTDYRQDMYIILCFCGRELSPSCLIDSMVLAVSGISFSLFPCARKIKLIRIHLRSLLSYFQRIVLASFIPFIHKKAVSNNRLPFS